MLPQADESAPEDTQERRAPAPKKKNRVNLETTKEEDETPPASPTQLAAEQLSTSPPYETKVRQISRKVRGMKWDDKDKPETNVSQDTQDVIVPAEDPEAEPQDANVELDAPTEIPEKERNGTPERPATTAEDQDQQSLEPQKEEAPPPDSTVTVDSDSDDQEKGLKRKIDERQTSISLEEQPSKTGAEASKRARDDNEEDDNPREKKRPTPEREQPETGEVSKDETPATPPSEPVAPQPKVVRSF